MTSRVLRLLGLLIAWWVIGRVLTLIFWAVVVAVVVMVASVLGARAAEPETAVFVLPLSPVVPEAACSPQSAARGVYLVETATLTVPAMTPGWHVVLASTPDGQGPIRVDDQVVLTARTAVGSPRRFSREFASQDGKTVLALPPQDVSYLLPRTGTEATVELTVELIDLMPPTCSASPLYLVGLAPATATPPATASVAPATPSEPTPVATAPAPIAVSDSQPPAQQSAPAATLDSKGPEPGGAAPDLGWTLAGLTGLVITVFLLRALRRAQRRLRRHFGAGIVKEAGLSALNQFADRRRD